MNQIEFILLPPPGHPSRIQLMRKLVPAATKSLHYQVMKREESIPETQTSRAIDRVT